MRTPHKVRPWPCGADSLAAGLGTLDRLQTARGGQLRANPSEAPQQPAPERQQLG